VGVLKINGICRQPVKLGGTVGAGVRNPSRNQARGRRGNCRKKKRKKRLKSLNKSKGKSATRKHKNVVGIGNRGKQSLTRGPAPEGRHFSRPFGAPGGNNHRKPRNEKGEEGRQ